MSLFEVWVSPALAQNLDVWNFHGSLAFHSVWCDRKMACFELCHFDHNALFPAVKVKVLFQSNIWLMNFLLDGIWWMDGWMDGWMLHAKFHAPTRILPFLTLLIKSLLEF